MNPLNNLKEKKTLFVNSTRITLKLVIILVLTLLLLIPQFMVKDLVRERGNRQAEVTNNISTQIGGEQDIVGPILCIPYFNEVEQISINDKQQQIKKVVQVQEYYYISPETLTIESNVQVENKKKSIYKVPVFQSQNNFNVKFPKTDLTNHKLYNKLQLQDAFLVIGTSNNKGILGQPKAVINGTKHIFQPGEKDVDLFQSGIHLPIDNQQVLSSKQFTIQLEFRGTNAINFASVAKANELVMQSNWAHPNFETSLIQNGSSRYYTDPYLHTVRKFKAMKEETLYR